MTGATLGRDEADAAIVALVAAHDRISAAMWGVDNHPGTAILADPGLTGQSLRYAVDLRARVGVLWSQFTALDAHLDQIRTVRGRRARPGGDELRELTLLLRTPVVPVGPDGMVADAPGQPVLSRLSLMDLARQLEATGADVSSGLSELVAARSAVSTTFDPVLADLDRLRAVVAELGPDADLADRLRRLEARLTEAYGAACADPLAARSAGAGAGGGPGTGAGSTTPDGRLRGLVAELAALRAAAEVLVALRDSYPRRAERLRATLDEMVVLRSAATEAHAAVREKIAGSGLPGVPDAEPGLRAQVAQLDQLHRERRWTRLADELAAAERAAETAVQRLVELRGAADGLLERRAELRGRLEAYRARVARLGFAEHAELSALRRRAEELLWAAPCDLPAATRALVAYQRFVNQISERGSR